MTVGFDDRQQLHRSNPASASHDRRRVRGRRSVPERCTKPLARHSDGRVRVATQLTGRRSSVIKGSSNRSASSDAVVPNVSMTLGPSSVISKVARSV